MVKAFKLGRRFSRFLDDSEEKYDRDYQAHSAEIERIKQMLDESGTCSFRRSKGRMATEEERIIASWANLAIEEPSFTLDEARRLHKQAKEPVARGT